MTQSVIPAIWLPRRVKDEDTATTWSDALLKSYYFERYVLDVCIATMERGGVTSKINTYQFFSSTEGWGVPRYPDRTVILYPGTDLPNAIAAFIHENRTSLREPDCWLGTWIDPDTGNCYLDITAIHWCLEEALREAIVLSQSAQRKIVALYDFKNEQPIYLSGIVELITSEAAQRARMDAQGD